MADFTGARTPAGLSRTSLGEDAGFNVRFDIIDFLHVGVFGYRINPPAAGTSLVEGTPALVSSAGKLPAAGSNSVGKLSVGLDVDERGVV